MLNIGGGELLIILLVALIFLGPSRLPDVARQMGQTVNTLRGLARGFQAELEAAARPDPLPRPDVATGTKTAELAEKARSVGDEPHQVKPISVGGPFEAVSSESVADGDEAETDLGTSDDDDEAEADLGSSDDDDEAETGAHDDSVTGDDTGEEEPRHAGDAPAARDEQA